MFRILVIDDDPSVRMCMQAWLQHEGFEVVLAGGGRDGIEAAEWASFDLVIVDIFMPEMDGLETIRALRRRAPAVPIIVMSGFGYRVTRAATVDFLGMGMRLGANHRLSKPFGPRQLLAAVNTGVAGSRLAKASLHGVVGRRRG